MEAATPCKLHIIRRRMGTVQSALWAAPEEAGNVWKLGLNRQWAKRWMLLCGPNLYYWANEKASKSGAQPTGVIRLEGSTISLDKTHESHPYAFVVLLPRPEGAKGTDDEWQYVLSTCSAEEADSWVDKLQTHATVPMTPAVLSTLMHSRTAANLDAGVQDVPWARPPWTTPSPTADGAVLAAGLQRVHEVHTAWRGVCALQAAAQLTQEVVQQNGRCLEQLMQRVRKRLGRENVGGELATAQGQPGPEQFLRRDMAAAAKLACSCVESYVGIKWLEDDPVNLLVTDPQRRREEMKDKALLIKAPSKTSKRPSVLAEAGKSPSKSLMQPLGDSSCPLAGSSTMICGTCTPFETAVSSVLCPTDDDGPTRQRLRELIAEIDSLDNNQMDGDGDGAATGEQQTLPDEVETDRLRTQMLEGPAGWLHTHDVWMHARAMAQRDGRTLGRGKSRRSMSLPTTQAAAQAAVQEQPTVKVEPPASPRLAGRSLSLNKRLRSPFNRSFRMRQQ